MSITYARSATTRRRATPEPVTVDGWERPAEWLAMPAVGAGDQRVVGLCAVSPNNDLNYVAFTVTGAYTVDWGDGTAPQNVASGVTVHKQLLWASYASSPLTADGERQAVITITPQAGALTSFALARHSVYVAGTQVPGWLDMVIAGSSIASLSFSPSGVAPRMMQRLRVLSHAITNGSSLLSGVPRARSCEFNMTGITNATSMFAAVPSLIELTLTGTVAPTNPVAMFQQCRSLRTLTSPTINLAGATSADSMFDACHALTVFPALSNTASITTTNAMFRDCWNLVTAPAMNLAACTNATNMFAWCSNLTTVTLTNTGLVTTWTAAFQGCSSLTAPPTLDTSGGTNFGTMFSSCLRLATCTTLNTANGTSFNNTFEGCPSLAAVNLNMAAATSASNMFAFGTSGLTSVILTGMRYSVSVSAALLDAAALDALYTSLGTAAGAQTITVTSNPGTAGDTPTIATGKGWTVTGS